MDNSSLPARKSGEAATNVDYLISLLRRGQQEPQRVPFCWVGAGLSIPAGYPSWGQLVDRVRKASLVPLPESDDPLETVDAFFRENGAASSPSS